MDKKGYTLKYFQWFFIPKSVQSRNL